MTALWAASVRSLAGISGRPLSCSSFLAWSTLVPGGEEDREKVVMVEEMFYGGGEGGGEREDVSW